MPFAKQSAQMDPLAPVPNPSRIAGSAGARPQELHGSDVRSAPAGKSGKDLNLTAITLASESSFRRRWPNQSAGSIDILFWRGHCPWPLEGLQCGLGQRTDALPARITDQRCVRPESGVLLATLVVQIRVQLKEASGLVFSQRPVRVGGS